MINFFVRLFSTDFMPHVYCLRSQDLVLLHAISDGLIALAYLLIPIGLIRLVQRRRDLGFHWLFVLFAVFILSCGATHVLSIVTLWYPVYRFEGLIKLITAVASMLTAVLLIRLIPQIALIPSFEQWRNSNQALKMEITQRENAQAELRLLNADLEHRVEQRTSQLEEQALRLQELTMAWDLSHGFIRNLEGSIDFWCEGSEQLYGWKKSEATGKNSHQLLQTAFPKPLVEITSELLENGSWSGELLHHTKEGDPIHVATHWVLRKDNKGQATAVIEVNNDITDRLRAAEANQKLANIVESSRDAIIGSTLGGIVTSWNCSAEALFGYTAAEMIGRSVHVLTPPEYRDVEIKIFEGVGGHAAARRYETVRLTKGKRQADVAMTLSPIKNPANQVIGTSMIMQDISEMKVQQAAIRLSEERQRLAVEAGQVGLWYLDFASGKSIWSQRCKELHGLKPEAEVPAYPISLTLIHPDDRKSVEADMKKIIDGHSDLSTEYRTRSADQKTRWVQSRGSARVDDQGAVIGAHGTVIDLTERREAENKLRRANIELEQFAYAAAHDLQEPLRNVALAAQMIRTPYAGLNGDQMGNRRSSDLLHTVIDNAQRMEAMVKDLLAYSRSLDGPEDANVVVDGNWVLTQALQNLKSAIEAKEALITADPLPILCMNEHHLLQIFQNLIGNALKYGRDQGVQIHIGKRNNSGDALLFVKDNGAGIAANLHDRAFKMFTRLHDDSVNGTGIGLAVCKRIVEHYGGRIWIESLPGEGATFLFSAPCVNQN